MNFVAAIVGVIIIGYAAAHPSGDQFSTPPAVAPSSDCVVTSQSNGPVDPAFEAKLRAATEQLCRNLNKEGA